MPHKLLTDTNTDFALRTSGHERMPKLVKVVRGAIFFEHLAHIGDVIGKNAAVLTLKAGASVSFLLFLLPTEHFFELLGEGKTAVAVLGLGAADDDELFLPIHVRPLQSANLGAAGSREGGEPKELLHAVTFDSLEKSVLFLDGECLALFLAVLHGLGILHHVAGEELDLHGLLERAVPHLASVLALPRRLDGREGAVCREHVDLIEGKLFEPCGRMQAQDLLDIAHAVCGKVLLIGNEPKVEPLADCWHGVEVEHCIIP